MIPVTHTVLDDTKVITYRPLWEKSRPAWEALVDWCRKHGLNPDRMPVENLIVRDVVGCRVEYTEFVLDEHGRRVLNGLQPAVRRTYRQGETPPMPWPAELLEVQP